MCRLGFLMAAYVYMVIRFIPKGLGVALFKAKYKSVLHTGLFMKPIESKF